jgi:peptidoglycan/LPS O-acetylase OafA/YrhL
MNYRPEFHGIRALATILVIAAHLGLPFPCGGYIAITVFFVLSGFLITFLLLEEAHRHGSIRLARFYLRRALRLLPALYLLLGSMLVVGSLTLSPAEVAELRSSCLVTVLGSSNWALAFGLNRVHGLTHTWSLTVEQQFYLLWPLIVFLLLRIGSRRSLQLLACSIAAAIVAATLSTILLWNHTHNWNRLYFAFDTHIPALLTGSLAAVGAFTDSLRPATRSIFARFTARRMNLLVCIASGLILLAVFFLPAHSPILYHGGLTVVALASATVLLALYFGMTPRLAALLRASPLVFVGELSYSLYLWHIPITLLYLRIAPLFSLPSPLAWLPPVGASLVAALFSYFVVERPCLNLKRLFRRDPETIIPRF